MTGLFLILIPIIFILAALAAHVFARGLYRRLIGDGVREWRARTFQVVAFIFTFVAVLAGLLFLMFISNIRFSRM